MITTCPRDGSRLDTNRSEYPSCLHCGYEDYSRSPPRRYRPISRRDVRTLRYRGPHRAMRELTVEISLLEPGNTKILYRTVCPFPDCGEALAEKETSFSRQDVRLTRYKCKMGHAVYLGFNGLDEWWS